MKVLFIVKSVDGGTGTFLKQFELMKRWKKIEDRVLVLEKPLYRKIAGTDYIYVNKNKKYPKKYNITLQNIISFVEEIIFVHHEIGKYKPMIIISIDLHANMLSIINQLLFYPSLKMILTTHINLKETIDIKSSKYLGYILKQLVRFFYPRAYKLVVVSEEIKTDLQKHFYINKEIHVIHNGVDNNLNKIISHKKQNNIIVSIGRLVEQKDFETLLQAFYYVLQKIKMAKLWIVGDGYLKNDLISKAKKIGILQNVVFFGWSNNVGNILKRSNVFVLSSYREGFPYVLLEAMGYSLPVISTDSPYGPSEILLGGKYGILVPVGNAKRIAIEIINILSNPSLSNNLSKLAFHRSKGYSINKMINSYYDLIK